MVVIVSWIVFGIFVCFVEWRTYASEEVVKWFTGWMSHFIICGWSAVIPFVVFSGRVEV